jgi:hypothetical protein
VSEALMTNSQKTLFRIALVLAIVADALQIILLPLFVEGAESMALGVCAVIPGEAGPGIRPGSALDTRGGECLQEIEEHRSKCFVTDESACAG